MATPSIPTEMARTKERHIKPIPIVLVKVFVMIFSLLFLEEEKIYNE